MKTKTVSASLLATLTALALTACAAEDPRDPRANAALDKPSSDDPTNPAPVDDTPAGPGACDGKAFVGFDGMNVVANRVVGLPGADRARLKPYDVLAGEFKRVLGATPASLRGAATTFGRPVARWYDEPTVGGTVLQTAYNIAFDGCLTYTETAAEFAAAPTAETASTQCAAMARKFWSKTPTTDQIAACVDVAVTATTPEPDARRRWSYACATVLTSSGFLTY